MWVRCEPRRGMADGLALRPRQHDGHLWCRLRLSLSLSLSSTKVPPPHGAQAYDPTSTTEVSQIRGQRQGGRFTDRGNIHGQFAMAQDLRGPASRAGRGPAVTESADVLVDGAGLAGLTGARDLVAAGRSVLVLEARDRVAAGSSIMTSATARSSRWGPMGRAGPGQDRLLALAADLRNNSPADATARSSARTCGPGTVRRSPGDRLTGNWPGHERVPHQAGMRTGTPICQQPQPYTQMRVGIARERHCTMKSYQSGNIG
jgi:hypothetical protein